MLPDSSRSAEASDRRGDPRHITLLRVGIIIGARGRELCLIRNISSTGVLAHVYASHRPGEKVAIELQGGRALVGEILWESESNIGIRFDDPIDVEEMLSCSAPLENGWKPRSPRIQVDRLATLRLGARVIPINTRDISQGGVGVESDQSLIVDSPVVLDLGGIRPVHGVVKWSRDAFAGIGFNQPLAFADLMQWLRPPCGNE